MAVRNVIFPHRQHAAGWMPITFFEAVVTGLAIGSAQQAPAPDMDTIRRGVVSMRPLLREGAREGVLAGCLILIALLSAPAMYTFPLRSCAIVVQPN